MEPKIFLLIAIFYIAESKKNLMPPLLKLGIRERGEIEKKIYPFPPNVVLLPVFEIQEPKNDFSNCYKSENKNHMEAINTFSTKIVDAMNLLNRELPSYLFKRRGINMRSQTESVRKLLNQYKGEFSTKLKENNFKAIGDHSKKYKDKILEELMDLFTELKGLDQSALWVSHRKTIETCDKTFEEEIKKASHKCQNLVERIKLCMETENAK